MAGERGNTASVGVGLNVLESFTNFCMFCRCTVAKQFSVFFLSRTALAFGSVVFFRKMRVCELKKVVFSNLSLEEKVKLKDSGRLY